MSSVAQSLKLDLPTFTLERLANFCGTLHENIRFLENTFQISIKIHQNSLELWGNSAKKLLEIKPIFMHLYAISLNPISLNRIESIITEKENPSTMSIQLSRKIITARNEKQSNYLKSIDNQDITFAIGPAGTGKTYLAVSKAIECFEKGEVQRLVFVRPAVEAGEKLGFLPGDLVEKVLPYLRPVYDALYEMIGFKEAQKMINSDVIEILPLAFMRGRTLNEAFIILDEAQNTTIPQMKMFLTRMGFASKVVVNGDTTQVDLPKGTVSGLEHAIKTLKNLKEIGIHTFTSQEVVRHPLISKIVDCYDNKGS